MDKRTINGVEWGRTLIGKAKNIPIYRKRVDGKWIAVKKQSIPQAVLLEYAGEKRITEPVQLNAEVVEFNQFGLKQESPVKEELPPEPSPKKKQRTLKELVEELYERFGIYTCYLQREPNVTDIHPVTGNLMTNFTLGQTRSQYLGASRNGANWNGEVMASIFENRKQDRYPTHMKEQFVEEEKTLYQNGLSMKEWREIRAAEKPIMRAEHGRRGDGTDEDELYAEPPINGRIIREYPTNPIAERRLDEARQRRSNQTRKPDTN